MKTHLNHLGNSKSVTLPADILAISGIGDDIELTAETGRIVITSAKPNREGWFDNYQEDQDEDVFAPLTATDGDTEEWEW